MPPATFMPTSRAFRRLATLTAIAVYALIVAGSVVRVTGSGLGCPDWPLCYGQVVPPPDLAALIEFSHRVIAALGGGLLLATLVAAWRRYRQRRDVLIPASVAAGLLPVQVPLGGLIVATELEPLVVAVHLGMAMLIFAATLATAAAAHRSAAAMPGLTPGYRRLLLGALAALFALLLSGALVAGSNAQLACPDWPLCQAGLLPPPGASPLIAIHLLHRYMVAAVSVLVIAVVAGALRQPGRTRTLSAWAVTLGGLFAAQVAIGAIQVALQLPALWRALHLAAASGVWASLVVLASLGLAGRRLRLAPRARRSPESAAAPSTQR